MKQSQSCEADSSSASQIPCISWSPKVHYCVHKSPPLVPVLSHHITCLPPPILLLYVPFNRILPSKLRSSKCFLSCRFLNQNTVHISLVYLACPTVCPSYPVTFDRLYNIRPHDAASSSLLLPPPATEISPSAPSSRTPSACFVPLIWETKFHTHTKPFRIEYEKLRRPA